AIADHLEKGRDGGREGGKGEIDRNQPRDFPRPAEQRDGCQPPPQSLMAAAGRFVRLSGNTGRNGIFKPRIHSRRTRESYCETYCVPTLASALLSGSKVQKSSTFRDFGSPSIWPARA